VSKRIPRSHWDRWIPVRGLIETTESASAASLRPLNLLPRPHWDCRICFCGLIETKPNFVLHSFVLKTTFLCENNVVKIFLNGFRRVIETAEAASAVSLKPPKRLPWSHWNRQSCFGGLIETAELRPLKQAISNDYLEFLVDFEAICEMAIARESGGVDWCKNWGTKISWHCPFNTH
jgi:hypothetical protein